MCFPPKRRMKAGCDGWLAQIYGCAPAPCGSAADVSLTLLKAKRKVPFSCFLTAALSLFSSAGEGDLVDGRGRGVKAEQEEKGGKHTLYSPFSPSSVLRPGIDS